MNISPVKISLLLFYITQPIAACQGQLVKYNLKVVYLTLLRQRPLFIPFLEFVSWGSWSDIGERGGVHAEAQIRSG